MSSGRTTSGLASTRLLVSFIIWSVANWTACIDLDCRHLSKRLPTGPVRLMAFEKAAVSAKKGSDVIENAHAPWDMEAPFWQFANMLPKEKIFQLERNYVEKRLPYLSSLGVFISTFHTMPFLSSLPLHRYGLGFGNGESWKMAFSPALRALPRTRIWFMTSRDERRTMHPCDNKVAASKGFAKLCTLLRYRPSCLLLTASAFEPRNRCKDGAGLRHLNIPASRFQTTFVIRRQPPAGEGHGARKTDARSPPFSACRRQRYRQATGS